MQRVSVLAVCLIAAMVRPGLAQQSKEPIETIGPETTFSPQQDEAQREYAAAKKKIRVMEQELRKLRRAHFGSIKRVDIRQEGLAQLRTYTEPAIFASLIEIFKNDADDVRTAVLDIFNDSKSDAGDAALAWVAMTDRDGAGVRKPVHQRGRVRPGT